MEIMAQELNFYDLRAREKFTTDKYKIVNKEVKGRSRKFAIAKSPISGIDCWRVV